jgi:hypothetical protein
MITMKRIFNYFTIIVSGLLFGLSSCDQTAERAFYDSSNGLGYSFYHSSESTEFSSEGTYKVKVARTDASQASTLPLTLTVSPEAPAGAFSLETPTVSFAAGEAEKDVTIKYETSLFEELSYAVTVSFDEEQKSLSGYGAITVTGTITLDWEDYATGTFTSELFGGSWPQPIKKAKGFEAYLLPSVYVDGVDFMVLVDAQGRVSNTNTPNTNGYYPWTTGYVYGSYGEIKAYMDPDPKYSYWDRTAKKAVFNCYFYVSAGNFGWNDEVLTW